jgi:glycosyltransferase involved in cell wall biosynthesis
MKINILTAYRGGGTYIWGRDLAAALCAHDLPAKHVHTLGALLCSPFYQDADVVHASIPLSYHLWKKPVVLTVHGEYPGEKNIWKFLYPAAIRKADIITTPSNFLKERLKLGEAIVIPNAVSPQQFEMVEHRDKDILNMVTVTSFHFPEKAKGVLNILEIIGRLPEETRQRIRFFVVGGGHYLEKIAGEKKKYNFDVEFTGELPDTKNVLEHSDLFLYYSHHDNFPMVILEAMACGLPVLTNDVGAVSEIIENEKDGYIAANDNAYFEYLLNLVNNLDLRARTGENGRRTVEGQFSWENITSRYMEIYSRLV